MPFAYHNPCCFAYCNPLELIYSQSTETSRGHLHTVHCPCKVSFSKIVTQEPNKLKCTKINPKTQESASMKGSIKPLLFTKLSWINEKTDFIKKEKNQSCHFRAKRI